MSKYYNWRPSQIWYRLKCWAWHRYTTIKPRYLPHTWCDRVELLPHIMFEVLSDFVENEASPCGEDEMGIEWYGEHGWKIKVDNENKYARDVIQDLYDWWHVTYRVDYPAALQRLYDEALSYVLPNHPLDWNDEFKDDKDRIAYGKCLRAVYDTEQAQERELRKNMHVLVRLAPFLWT